MDSKNSGPPSRPPPRRPPAGRAPRSRDSLDNQLPGLLPNLLGTTPSSAPRRTRPPRAREPRAPRRPRTSSASQVTFLGSAAPRSSHSSVSSIGMPPPLPSEANSVIPVQPASKRRTKKEEEAYSNVTHGIHRLSLAERQAPGGDLSNEMFTGDSKPQFEPVDIFPSESSMRSKGQQISNAFAPHYQAPCAQILNQEAEKEGESLFLFQMPFALPFDNPSPEQEEEEEEDSPLCRDLSSLSPGKIGELFLYESGKAVICIGEVSYEVTNGVHFAFANEIATLNMSESLQDCSLSRYGNLNQKFILSLDAQESVSPETIQFST